MNTRIFDGCYNATAPPLHLCFACAFRPAGSLKWDTCAQVWPRHNSVLLRERMLAISWLHFSFERNIVMLGNRMVFVNWPKSVTWVWAIIVENWIVNCLLSMPGVHCMFSFLMENFAWSSWNFKLVQILFGTLAAQSFYFVMENSWLAWAGAILSLCKCFLKLRLEIILLWTHDVHYLFSCVVENSWLGQVEFWACAIILEN